MFFTGKIIPSLNFADGTYEKRQLKMFKEIGRIVQYMPGHQNAESRRPPKFDDYCLCSSFNFTDTAYTIFGGIHKLR